MEFTELQDRLQKLTNAKIKRVDIAKALGIFESCLSRKIKNGHEATNEDMEKISRFFKVSLSSLRGCETNYVTDVPSADTAPASGCIRIDYYPDNFASCGNGSFVLSNEKEAIDVPVSIFKPHNSQQYFAIKARGDSMQPHIMPDDILIVRDCQNEPIYDNKIYVFCYNDCIYTKRLAMNIDEILVKSDNPEYERKSIRQSDIESFKLIGEVVGLMRKE